LARDGGDRVDVVGSTRAGIDPGDDAVLQAHGRTFLAAAGMGVDVDQAGGDDLAARIDRLSGIAGNIGLDRRDLAAGDRHVPNAVDPGRRIDNASTPDDQIVCCRERIGNAGQQCGASGRGTDKLPSVHHGRLSIALRRVLGACCFGGAVRPIGQMDRGPQSRTARRGRRQAGIDQAFSWRAIKSLATWTALSV
jgi:hypothetical protein